MVQEAPANQTALTELIMLGFTSQPSLARLLFGLFLVMYMVTLLGNGLIVALVWADPSLHTPMYFFLISLSCSETAYTLVVVPRMLGDLLSLCHTISFSACATQMFFFVALGVTDCLLLTGMAVDRYMAICSPLRYSAIMNYRICCGLVGGALTGGVLFSLILSVLVFSLPFCGPKHIPHFFCDIPPVLRLVCPGNETSETAIHVLVVLTLILPFVFILLSYIRILMAVLCMGSAQHRRKAFSTCGAHLTVVLLHYSCAIFMYARPRVHYMPEKDRLIAVSYTIVIPMLNPLIYTLRNNDVQGALHKLLGCGPLTPKG
ncbi:olfactory receptor 10R2-like [Alligator sinensis]|uniref:Olfactory receptor n=1 Tax=Alligator sinensis TaxID=38654 RepID=A0A1U7RBM8_ALLSI|nr:olfactory receptor 10R2-like [Alligator sinensis]